MKTFVQIWKVVAIVAIVAFPFAASIACVSALVYGISWAFDFNFSWKLAIGIWLTLVLLKLVFSTNDNK